MGAVLRWCNRVTTLIIVNLAYKMEANGPPYIYVERTLAIIKPDAVPFADDIEEIILKNGFFIIQV